MSRMLRFVILFLLMAQPLHAGHAKIPKVCKRCAAACSAQVPACVAADPALATCTKKSCLRKVKRACRRNLTACCRAQCKVTGEVVCCGSSQSSEPTSSTTTSTSATSSSTTSPSQTSTTSLGGTTTSTSIGSTTSTTLSTGGQCTTSADCGPTSCCMHNFNVGTCCDVNLLVANNPDALPAGCKSPYQAFAYFACCVENSTPDPINVSGTCAPGSPNFCPTDSSCQVAKYWTCGHCSDEADKFLVGYCQYSNGVTNPGTCELQ